MANSRTLVEYIPACTFTMGIVCITFALYTSTKKHAAAESRLPVQQINNILMASQSSMDSVFMSESSKFYPSVIGEQD